MYKIIILGFISSLLMSLGQTFAQSFKDKSPLNRCGNFAQVSDSLELSLTECDSALKGFSQRIDSLKKSIKDPQLYFVDAQIQYTKLSERLKVMDSLTFSVDSKINKIDSLVSQKQSMVDSLLRKFNLPTSNILHEIPNLSSPPLNQLKIPFPQLPQLKNHLPASTLITSGNPALKIPETTLPALNTISIPQDVDKASENVLKKLKPVNELTKSQEKAESLLNQAKDNSKTLQDPKALQQKAKEEFIDHLAGKEEIIKKDMEDISRLQMKYRDVADSRLLPKHKWKMNAMKNKALIERVCPGLGLEIFSGDNISVNAAPTLSYKISGTFQSGLSAFKRVTYFKKDESLRLVNCYGFRFFTQAKVFKAFHVYGEFERHKPDLPIAGIFNSNAILQTDGRTLQNKINIGLVHVYAIGKNINGYFVLLYDMKQMKKFPNTSGSSARFGFQYELKKTKK